MISWDIHNLPYILITCNWAHSYLNILFEFLKEHLFVILINMNLLSIINKIIVFERRQLFSLKQTKIPVRAGLWRGAWWSCWLVQPPCLRSHPRAASPPWHTALHNCTHGALSLAYPSWKLPRRYVLTGQQMQPGQNLHSILDLHWTLICIELLPRCHLSKQLAISEVKTQSIPHNKGPASGLTEEGLLHCTFCTTTVNVCKCLITNNYWKASNEHELWNSVLK